MTNRERILAALSGEEVDRPPVWLLFPWHRCSYYADVRTEPSYAAVVEAMRRDCAILDRRNFDISPFRDEVEDRLLAIRDGEAVERRRILSHRGRGLEARLREDPRGNSEKRLLESEADLEFFLSLPVEDRQEEVDHRLEPFLARHREERDELPADAAATMLDLGEGIGELYHASSLLEYPIWSLERREEIAAFLRRLQGHFLAKYRFCLERDLAEVYFLVGSELAAPPIVGYEAFDAWVLPFERELVELVHSYGKLVVTHFHGRVKGLLGRFLEIGPDALHTIEAPPVGDCGLAEAYDAVGDRMTLIGNLQYDEFRALSPDAMRDAVEAVLREAAGRRFVLSPTAGPYEARLSPAMAASYLAFIEAGTGRGAAAGNRETVTRGARI